MPDSETVDILLVEDNPADAELTLHALKRNHVADRILHLEDGAEALDFLFLRGAYLNRPPTLRPHLVLLDLNLPKIDGLQVLKEVKNCPATRAIPIILLTSSTEQRDLVASYQLGANSYIQKPVSFTEFQEVVRHLGMYWLLINQKPPAVAFLTS
jgi:two-component system, response regulator